ncbi:MAG: transcription termination/antitermination protein NusA [Ruminococcaceae bacterium]|nr:transcription termination/antitermination protein NusA [Oscillospiraceae bacterium]
MNQEFMSALTELSSSKNIDKEVILEAIEKALIVAYKKNYGHAQNVEAVIDRKTGVIKLCQQKIVVETVEDSNLEIALTEAQQLDGHYQVGDTVNIEIQPRNFGRIAAQTAKQVVVQRINEAENENAYEYYRDKENTLLSGVITKVDKRGITVQIDGNQEADLPVNEQLSSEVYQPGARFKFYVVGIKATREGPKLTLSRSHPGLVRCLFEQEVPELSDGVVEIKTIAREAGSRSKISVFSNDPNVDAVGSCVGPRGTRVQYVCDELCGEKIDIVRYYDDPIHFIEEALSPSEVVSVTIDEEAHAAHVIVPAHQLSLAIGKAGQNARLAARLTGWKIDIKPEE